MEDRYDEFRALPDDDPVPEYRHNFEKALCDDEDSEVDVPLTSRQSSARRRDRLQRRLIYEESLSNKKRAASGHSNFQDLKSAYTSEHRTNVSQIAQRFKVMEDQTKITVTRDDQRLQTESQKYRRDLKDQRNDRFNTQPVTYEEVREAVLQNQRNATSELINSDSDTLKSCDIDPSKLSLTDRVRFFNQRIATETITKAGVSLERAQRRRPAHRYKTQPVTSEEVEVASRRIPRAIPESRIIESDSDDAKFVNPGIVAAPPRSILKYSTSQNASEKRTRSGQSYDNRDTTDSPVTAQIDYKDKSTRRLRADTREGRENVKRLDEIVTTNANTAVPCAFVSKDCDKNELGYDIADDIDINYSSVTTKRIRQRVNRNFVQSSISETNIVMTDVQHSNVDIGSKSIRDRMAALERSGTTDWKRRVNTETVPVSSGLPKFINYVSHGR